MKKMAVALSALLCLFLFAGCGKSTPIQGTWADDVGNVYRFEKNLTFSIDTGDEISIGGTYSVPKESNQVSFVMNMPEGQPVTTEGTFVIEDKTLTITGTDGSVTVLHKN